MLRLRLGLRRSQVDFCDGGFQMKHCIFFLAKRMSGTWGDIPSLEGRSLGRNTSCG